MKLQLFNSDKTVELNEFDTTLLNTEEYMKYVEYMKYESCFLLVVDDNKYLVSLNNGECIICAVGNDFIQYLTEHSINVQSYLIKAFIQDNKLYCKDKRNNKFVFDKTLSKYEDRTESIDKIFDTI